MSENKRDIFLKEGWVEVESKLDFDYISKLDLNTSISKIGEFLYNIRKETVDNIFGVFNRESKDAYRSLVSYFTPTIQLDDSKYKSLPVISGKLHEKKDPDYTEFFEYLESYLIKNIIPKLGPADFIYCKSDGDVYTLKSPETINLENIWYDNRMHIIWEDIGILTARQDLNYRGNPSDILNFFITNTEKFKEIKREVLSIGAQVFLRSYDLGKIESPYKLNSFPTYTHKHVAEIKAALKTDFTNIGILVEGDYGTGKTSWVKSLAAEILAADDYLILQTDFNTLQTLTAPSYVDKLCVIIDDADNIAIDRANGNKETQDILAWLDSNRSTFLKSLNNSSEDPLQVITIFTVNSSEMWDKAALRKGRIDYHFMFNEKLIDE